MPLEASSRSRRIAGGRPRQHFEVSGGGFEQRFGGAVDTVTLSGGYGIRQHLPSDVIRAVQRIPAAFAGYRISWS